MTDPAASLEPAVKGEMFGSPIERQATVDALRLRLAAMDGRAGGRSVETTAPTAAHAAAAELSVADTAGSDTAGAGNALANAAVANTAGNVDAADSADSAVTTDGARGWSGVGRGARRGREPGGHPEDELGDPETAAKNICLRLLTDSARPRANLFEALKKRGIEPAVANKVLDRYTDLGLIDDGAYAQAYVRSKHKERGLGKRALTMELRRKGIDDVVVAEAVQEVNSDDEWERGKVLIAKRVASAMSAGPEAARRRLVGLLARRGYSASMSYELVNSALRDFGVDDGDAPNQDDMY